MAKEPKSLPRSEILARLKKAKAEGNLSEEQSKILRQALHVSGPMEQETDNQIYKVNFVSHKLDRFHDDER
ncbi:MAG: hypothetical protein VX780_04700 [Pseudomonadota bacterium]|nr:hypothetical protein [Pseudomonadota bacterium]